MYQEIPRSEGYKRLSVFFLGFISREYFILEKDAELPGDFEICELRLMKYGGNIAYEKLFF